MKLYEMMNQVKKSGDPVEALRNIIETEVANRMNTGFVGKKSDVILPDSFFGKEMKVAEVSELPKSHLLRTREYNNIKKYFSSDKRFNTLSEREQLMVESMRLSPEEFQSYYPDDSSQAKAHELRAQLQNELVQDEVLSLSEVAAINDVEIQFEITQQL